MDSTPHIAVVDDHRLVLDGIVADERVDFASSHLEVDAGERFDPGERLGDPLGPQQRNLIVAHQPCLVSRGRPPKVVGRFVRYPAT